MPEGHDKTNYNSFGSVVYESNTAIHHFVGFAGGHLDVETGFVEDYHRWYDPATGRWLSPDPEGFAAGDANLSRYVGNDPTTTRDIRGLAAPTAQQLEAELSQALADYGLAWRQIANLDADIDTQHAVIRTNIQVIREIVPRNVGVEITGVEDYAVLNVVIPPGVVLKPKIMTSIADCQNRIGKAKAAIIVDKTLKIAQRHKISSLCTTILDLEKQIHDLQNPSM